MINVIFKTNASVWDGTRDSTWLPSQAHPLLRKAACPVSQAPRTLWGRKAQGRGPHARSCVGPWLSLLLYLSQGVRFPGRIGVLKWGQELVMSSPWIRLEKYRLRPNLGLAMFPQGSAARTTAASLGPPLRYTPVTPAPTSYFPSSQPQ